MFSFTMFYSAVELATPAPRPAHRVSNALPCLLLTTLSARLRRYTVCSAKSRPRRVVRTKRLAAFRPAFPRASEASDRRDARLARDVLCACVPSLPRCSAPCSLPSRLVALSHACLKDRTLKDRHICFVLYAFTPAELPLMAEYQLPILEVHTPSSSFAIVYSSEHARICDASAVLWNPRRYGGLSGDSI